MTNPQDRQDRQATALFRYGLIADLIHLPPGSRGLYARLREKAAADYSIPGSRRIRVAPETLRHWLKAWRRGGFDALLPKGRADQGRSRALPQAVADALLIAAVAGSVPDAVSPAPSTVHRLLSRAGLMDQAGDAESGQDRRRFAFAHPGQLWMSDVMHGPSVLLPDSRIRRKTYLIAFLDDATRVVPYCAFAMSENTQAFLPVFKQALLRRVIPQRLYVDNGANSRSRQLALVYARLGVALIHARPHQPQGKGKQERFFRTVRSQLLATLSAADTDSLDALNRRLWAWVEAEYHHHPHRGLDGQTPLDRWAASSITGEVGSGKTTVCRQLASTLHPGLHRLFYGPLSTGNVMDMYKAIAWQLGLPVERNRASAYRAIHAEVCRLAVECRIHPVLVVDEAQHLRNDVLEDLRLLTNYAMDSEPRLCLLLIGLTELRRRLSMAVHESLAQRIVVRYHLGGLARDELPGYLDYRLRLADLRMHTPATPLFGDEPFRPTRPLPPRQTARYPRAVFVGRPAWLHHPTSLTRRRNPDDRSPDITKLRDRDAGQQSARQHLVACTGPRQRGGDAVGRAHPPVGAGAGSQRAVRGAPLCPATRTLGLQARTLREPIDAQDLATTSPDRGPEAVVMRTGLAAVLTSTTAARWVSSTNRSGQIRRRNCWRPNQPAYWRPAGDSNTQ